MVLLTQMGVTNDQIYKYISDLGILDSNQLEEALVFANQSGQKLGDVLYDRDLLTDSQIGQSLADLLHLPFVNLQQSDIPSDTTDAIPYIYQQKQLIVPIRKDQHGLHVAVNDPSDEQSLEFVAKKTGLPIVVHFATEKDFHSYFEKRTVSTTDFVSTIKQLLGESTSGDDKTPIIQLVDKLVTFAYQNRASDIHIEPQEKESLVRFRIDSVLHDVARFPLSIHAQVATRIKVMSHLKIDEHNSAQDGKFQFTAEGEKIDIRVSFTPIVQGEKIVMRLLSSKSRQFSLTNLGLNDFDLEKVVSAYKKPFGMILSTGPTGSGKTTTLYSILKLLNTRDINIMTIEDPVEYEVDGINQIQVNLQTNLTFADGLKSIVRQDPNVILVGEIRDEETADIAANAAMTGHLVLSTLHTNDAATTIPRLFDMNIEPFIIASSINCIIGQRLVRQICSQCRTSVELTKEQLVDLGLDEQSISFLLKDKEAVRAYKGGGCTICHQTGYSGRIGIYEVMTIDSSVREAITKKATSAEIQKLAISAGMTPMLVDGLKKVQNGITTIEEILRVTRT
jgi:type IV pilus assembly protein PilB